MSAQEGFPRALLAQPLDDRLTYFKGYTVAHPFLAVADEALRQAIGEPAGASLIFVFGPTGVGKTTLRRHVEEQVRAAAAPLLTREPDHIPIIGLEAVAPESGNFNWKDYYLRALSALDDPFLNRSLDPGLRASLRDGRLHLGIGRGVVAPTLRRALEQALRYRRPAAVLVDEAQHLAKMASGRKLQDQLDAIKSLATMTGTVHVLLGTYDLLACRNLSGQLSRRSLDIHFPRYRGDHPEEARAFKSVLWAFQRHLPLDQEPDLLRHWEFCYERSVGCVGVLKEWLTHALAAALHQGETTLSVVQLERCALAVSQCLKMVTDIREGESTLAEPEAGRSRLQSLLSLEAAPPVPRARQAPGARTPQQEAAAPSRTATVGDRTPRRDPVVGGQHGL